MPKRFENGYFALTLVCLLCLVCIAYVSFTFSFSYGYQRANEEHSTYYAERDQTETNYRECLDASTSLKDARACIDNSPIKSREAERAEQDLNAQREMAQWAEGMLWAAWIVGILTLVATVAGVRLVQLTFIATQEMASDTLKIGMEQVAAASESVLAARDANAIVARQLRASYKPWISVEIEGDFLVSPAGKPFGIFAQGEDSRNVGIFANIFVRNIGDIPVTIEDFELQIEFSSDWAASRIFDKGSAFQKPDFFTVIQSKERVGLDPTNGVLTGVMTASRQPIAVFMMIPEDRVKLMGNYPPIIGHVLYSDPLGVRYAHYFAFVATHYRDGGFKRYGGRVHNRECEINSGDHPSNPG